eukprot:CAMPEP_0180821876 /NCGR_PEP_ID=MMETSP1038_2-20121128/71066_1 /TAXON_ID=632150 /ORGANISM="Azadinium spinosum, Strain 3D9" /LENGTH=51 /DNA_ID=CAMNT_0022864091 /DNA_START=42 /DNA_END=194 /DNA_ORIENTATION=+
MVEAPRAMEELGPEKQQLQQDLTLSHARMSTPSTPSFKPSSSTPSSPSALD